MNYKDPDAVWTPPNSSVKIDPYDPAFTAEPFTDPVAPEPTQVGGCKYYPDGTRVQLIRCQSCMWGQCPGGQHDWADVDDIEHARATGQPSPEGQPCNCDCIKQLPEVDLEDVADEDMWLDWQTCPVCGSEAACGYDNEGRPLIHALPAEDDDS